MHVVLADFLTDRQALLVMLIQNIFTFEVGDVYLPSLQASNLYTQKV